MPTATLHLSLNAKGPEVKKLHDALGKAGFKIPKNETDAKFFGAGTKNALLQLQKKHKLSLSGVFDEKTKAALSKASTVAEAEHQRIEGRLFLDNGLPAEGVQLQLFNTGYGGNKKQLAQTQTDDEGFYAFSCMAFHSQSI